MHGRPLAGSPRCWFATRRLFIRASLRVSCAGCDLLDCEKVSSIPKYGHYHASWRHCWELRQPTVRIDFWEKIGLILLYRVQGYFANASSWAVVFIHYWLLFDIWPPSITQPQQHKQLDNLAVHHTLTAVSSRVPQALWRAPHQTGLDTKDA